MAAEAEALYQVHRDTVEGKWRNQRREAYEVRVLDEIRGNRNGRSISAWWDQLIHGTRRGRDREVVAANLTPAALLRRLTARGGFARKDRVAEENKSRHNVRLTLSAVHHGYPANPVATQTHTLGGAASTDLAGERSRSGASVAGRSAVEVEQGFAKMFEYDAEGLATVAEGAEEAGAAGFLSAIGQVMQKHLLKTKTATTSSSSIVASDQLQSGTNPNWKWGATLMRTNTGTGPNRDFWPEAVMADPEALATMQQRLHDFFRGPPTRGGAGAVAFYRVARPFFRWLAEDVVARRREEDGGEADAFLHFERRTQDGRILSTGQPWSWNQRRVSIAGPQLHDGRDSGCGPTYFLRVTYGSFAEQDGAAVNGDPPEPIYVYGGLSRHAPQVTFEYRFDYKHMGQDCPNRLDELWEGTPGQQLLRNRPKNPSGSQQSGALRTPLPRVSGMEISVRTARNDHYGRLVPDVHIKWERYFGKNQLTQ
eukprot:g18596.t1